MNHSITAMEVLDLFGAYVNNGGDRELPPLFRAINDGSEEQFKFLLDHGADPNACNGNQSILMAVMRLDPQVAPLKARLVDLLLKRNASPYRPNEGMNQPLITGVKRFNLPGWSLICLDKIIEAIPEQHRQGQLNDALRTAANDGTHPCLTSVFHLLDRGADPMIQIHDTKTLLHLVCQSWEGANHKDDFAALLRGQPGVYINAIDDDGQTALHYAVKEENLEFVLVLLEQGAMVDVRSASGKTPLSILCSNRRHRGTEYTISKPLESVQWDPDPSVIEGVRELAAHRHETKGRERDIQYSLNEEEIVQALLEHGADPALEDEQGRNCLMMACGLGEAVLAANIIYSKGIPEATSLIAKKDIHGCTALHLAAIDGHVDVLRLLLNPKGVFKREVNVWRQRAVEDDARTRMVSEPDQISRLRAEEEKYEELKASIPDLSDLMHACVAVMEPPEPSVFTIGSEKRRDRDRIELPNVNFLTWTAEKDDYLPWLRQRDNDGWTAMHHIAANGHLEATKLMVQHDPVLSRIKNGEGKTPGELAVEDYYFDVQEVIHQAAVEDAEPAQCAVI